MDEIYTFLEALGYTIGILVAGAGGALVGAGIKYDKDKKRLKEFDKGKDSLTLNGQRITASELAEKLNLL